jgi:hypothetical protein
VYIGNIEDRWTKECLRFLGTLMSTMEMQLFVYIFRAVDLALKSSSGIYPIHCFVLLSFAVVSVVGVLVFVAVVAAVVALRASKKQNMSSISLVSVV